MNALVRRVGTALRIIPQQGAVAKTSEWSKLWLRALESQLVGGKVTKPYAEHWAVYLAINQIAQNIASIPFILKDGDNEIEKHPIIDLFNNPNEQLSNFQLWEATLVFLNLRGEAFWVMSESMGQMIGKKSVPAEIHVLNPDRFKPAVDVSGELVGWVYQGRMPLKLEDVIHFKFFNPYNDIRGLAPLEAARISMNTDHSAELFNEAFFDNAAVPEGLLTTEQTLTDSQFKKLQEQWKSKHGGVKKAHKTAILEAGLEYKELTLKHREMDFLEQRKFSLEQILGVYGVPKAIALTQDLRYATALVQRKAFWIDTLLPQMRLIEEKLNSNFFRIYAPNINGIFDKDDIEELREDLKDKTAIAKDLFFLGFTSNEINTRLRMGFPEEPWRDVPYRQMSLIPANEPVTEPAKGMSKAIEFKQAEDMFSAYQEPLERAYLSKLRKYFYRQRGRVLAVLSSHKTVKQAEEILSEISAFWDEEAEELKVTSEPFIYQGIEAGQILALEMMGLAIDFTMQDPEIITLLDKRVNLLKGISNNVWKVLRDQISEGLAEGETIDDIAGRIRAEYNQINGSRSRTIARTETAGAMNESSFTKYHSEGVKKKRWATARDERVRATHREAGAQGAIPFNKKFNNGLMHPNDPNGTASEVINCRCVLIPTMEE